MKNADFRSDLSPKRLDDVIISEEVRLKAEDELNETCRTRKESLEKLRSLIQDEVDLAADMNEEFLLQFLRVRKFKAHAAFCQLRNFYRHRLNYPTLYKTYSPNQNLKVMKANLLNFLPLRTPEGCAVWVARIGLWDPEAFDYDAFLRFGLLCTEKALQNPVTQICGVVSIADFQEFSWTHLFHMPASSIRCFVKASQDSFPIRHREIHVINNPSIFGILFAIIKPFLSSKIRDRIHLHGYNLESLHQFLSPSILPEEFGGTQGPFKNDMFYTCLLESDKEFLANKKFGYKIET